MIPIHKILVPVALSPRCAWAARYASRLAPQLGAEPIFLHVANRPSFDELKSFLARQIAVDGYDAVSVEGDPAEQIIRFAQVQSCDLILMPTHAYGRFRRYLLGSVTAKVLHDAACPVWTGVHHEDTPLPDDAVIRSITCAVDFDPNCIAIMQWAQDLAATFKATLKVIHAVAAADETSDNAGEIELRRYLFRQAGERFAALCGAAGLKPPIALAGGPTGRVVRETVLREKSDLVVIGRGHSQSTLGRLRTQAYSIIRESPCPVLSI